MTDATNTTWALLEQKIDDLINERNRLREENQRLRDRESSLKEDKQQLTQVNLQTRTKVEAMLTRLKALESTS